PTWPSRLSPTSRKASVTACRWGSPGSSRSRSPTRSCSWPATRPGTSRAPSCRSTRAPPTTESWHPMTDVAVDDPLVADLDAYRAAVREFLAGPPLDRWRGAYLDANADEMRFT